MDRTLRVEVTLVLVVMPLVITCLILHDGSIPTETNSFLETIKEHVKTVPQLIKYWGYPSEEHLVTTEDGYTLTIHRIPGQSESKKIPVMMGHSLVGTSAIWTFGPTSNSLAYILADQGYDVWMHNIRGNSYSKNHSEYEACTSCANFWEFSFDESARFDYPAAVDYILKATGHEQLYFVGYSMATTQYLVMLSEVPRYNSKIRAGFLLGPTAFGGNATNPLLPVGDHAETIQTVLNTFGIYELLPNFLEVKSWLAHLVCNSTPLSAQLCSHFFALCVGSHPDRMNATMAATYMSQLPAGTSTKTFVHYAQLFRNGGRFTKYDYGRVKNLQVYGSADPPDYCLQKIRVPTHLFVGTGDGFSTPDDSALLESRLINANVTRRIVPRENWSHLDFILSVDAPGLVYKHILEAMDLTSS